MKQLPLPFIPPDPRDFRHQEDYGDDWRIVIKAFTDDNGFVWYEWTLRGPDIQFFEPNRHATCGLAVQQAQYIIDRYNEDNE